MIVPSTGDPTFIALNTSKPPFNDINLRRALSYATDVQQAISTIGLGVGHLATEPYPPGSKWYSPSGYPTAPDLTKARALIAQYKSAHGITGNVKINLQCLAGRHRAVRRVPDARFQRHLEELPGGLLRPLR
jgi:ABC-type transport system substrate-binding protein